MDHLAMSSSPHRGDLKISEQLPETKTKFLVQEKHFCKGLEHLGKGETVSKTSSVSSLQPLLGVSCKQGDNCSKLD